MPNIALGRIGLYRNVSGHYDLPAIVVTTPESFSPEGLEGPSTIPAPEEGTVHILVFSPGTSYVELGVPVVNQAVARSIRFNQGKAEEKAPKEKGPKMKDPVTRAYDGALHGE